MKQNEKTQEEFANFIFSELYNSTIDEDGRPYVEVYSFEIEELVKEMFNDLKILLETFGEYTLDDVEKIFTLNFWSTQDIIECENIREIALKFDELYGESLGDAPTFA